MPVVNNHWTAPDKAWFPSLPGQGLFKVIKGRGGKDLFSVSDIEKSLNTPIHQLCLAKGIAMDIEQHAVEVSGAAEIALKSLKESLDKFKGTLANDLTAIKAASTRVQSEALQMKQAYTATSAMLTTPDFERAVANAERMAVALKAISELSDTKLSVSMFSAAS
ncbi:MAG: hypothetical protein IPK42_10555 [Betaproteobacteria bacterium]|nr:hypothetical protein [Betaproteobacteria bacterium]